MSGKMPGAVRSGNAEPGGTSLAPRPDRRLPRRSRSHEGGNLESRAATGPAARQDRAGQGIELLARAGYVAKGTVYVAVGTMSAIAAAGWTPGGPRSSRGALGSLASAPFGYALLWMVAVGLVGYVLWRVVQALADPEQWGAEAKGLAMRATFLLTAFVYGGLALWVFRVLLADPRGAEGGGASAADTWSARLLSQPFGAWVLGAFAVGVIGYGVMEFVRAKRATFETRLRRDLHGHRRRWVRRVARAGLVSRGIVFLIIGGFLLHTAWTADASDARGLDGALQALQGQPHGPVLMGVVAAGLAAYGVLQWVKAWYRRIG